MGASSYRLLDAANSNTIEGFLQHGRRRSKKTAQSWRVSGGLSALAHEPAQQQIRRKNQSRKQTQNKKNLCNPYNSKTTQPPADAELYHRSKLQIPPPHLARDIGSCWRSPALV